MAYPRHHRPVPTRPIAAGYNDEQNPLLLQPGETPDCLNVDFDAESVRISRGSIKYGNRVAPTAALRTRVDPQKTPLRVASNGTGAGDQTLQSVPMRGFAVLPYSSRDDIGGDFAETGADPATKTFHTRRGKDAWTVEVSFQIPEEEKLFAVTPGESSDSTALLYGYDEALDECFCILQKGGDRLSMMSWAIAVVNVGDKFEELQDHYNSQNDLNPYGTIEDFQEDLPRESNYALAFLWLDGPGPHHADVERMRYDLDDPSSSSSGRYQTLAYRAFLIGKWVVPGKTYHLGLTYKQDTAAMTDSSWNEDGRIAATVIDDDGKVEHFGYSRTNKVRFGEDIHEGVIAGYWDDHTNSTVEKVDLVNPIHGGRGWTLIETTAAGDAGRVFQEGVGVWPAAGTWMSLTTYVKRRNGQQFRWNLRRGTGTPLSHSASFEWVAGVPTVISSSSGVTASIQDVGNDVYRVGFFYQTLAADAGQRMDVFMYFGMENDDILQGVAGEGDYTWGLMVAEGVTLATYEVNQGLWPLRGPADSLEYFTKYGIRWSERAPVHVGLGQRFIPWKDESFIPLGFDAAPLEHGGFSMLDRTQHMVTTNMGLTFDHTAGQGFLGVDQRGLASGNGSRFSPTGPEDAVWEGFAGAPGAPDPTTAYNEKALFGYRVILGDNATSHVGGICTIDYYLENAAADYRLYCDEIDTDLGTFSDARGVIQCFRWHQRELVIGEIRFWDVARAYVTDPRARFSLRSAIWIDDPVESSLSFLVSYWPCDDAGGGELRELMGGRNGYLSPFTLGTSELLDRGGTVFLSGEGEALVLDLSEDPVFKREFLNALRSGTTGWAIEFEALFLEEFHGLDVDDGSEITAHYAPHVASWEHPDPVDAGFEVAPKPLGLLTFRTRWANSDTDPVYFPTGLQFEVSADSDQENNALTVAVPYYDVSGATFNFDNDAPWVGRWVKLQFGIEPTSTEDQYKAYIAVSPREAFSPDEGEPPGSEYGLFSTVTVQKKDIERSVIVIGGNLNPGSLYGSTELNCRMAIRRPRVYASTAPGELPASSGASTTPGTGKLSGSEAYPPRNLSQDDILRRLGNDVDTVNLEQFSTAVESPGASISVEDSARTIQGVKGGFLRIAEDVAEVPAAETEPSIINRFYFVDSVDADGSGLTLVTPYAGVTKDAASARVFRHAGASDLADDIRDRRLVMGTGETYKPSASSHTPTFTPIFFTNLAPVFGGFGFRVYSPLASASPTDLFPRWTRGLAAPRENSILGLHNLNEEAYAGTRGCLYKVDDRWRRDGPTETYDDCLEFLARRRGDRLFPLQGDVLDLEDYSNVALWESSANYDDTTWVWDVYVFVEDIGEIQTIAWCGDVTTDPEQTPSALHAGRGIEWWLRLNRGRPELVFESDAVDQDSNLPLDGRYIVTANSAIPMGEWAHIRISVQFSADLGGSQWVAYTPLVYINGKNVSARVNARQLAATSIGGTNAWVKADSVGKIGQPYPGSGRLIVGAAPDFQRDVEHVSGWVPDGNTADQIRPNRVRGLMHALGGRLCRFYVWTTTGSAGATAAPFVPARLNYTTTTNKLELDLQEGVGHLVTDGQSSVPGVIRSHPFLSIYHEHGNRTKPFTFANNGNEVYSVNGGRPVIAEDGKARRAGLMPPATAPSFLVQRSPLWERNDFDTTSGSPDADPVQNNYLDGTDIVPVYHYRTLGRASLRLEHHADMLWEIDDVFAFKALVKFDSIAGRIPLYSARESVASGGIFFECRDGFAYIGWYDVELKKEVYIRTNQPVFQEGYWYYVFLRKRYPDRKPRISGLQFNWLDTWVIKDQFGSPGGDHADGDMLVVRRMAKATQDTTKYDDWTGFDMKATVDCAVSFTSTEAVSIPGLTNITGRVTWARTAIYTGAASGVVNATGNPVFHDDMVGMLWKWVDGEGFDDQTFRVVAVNSDTQIVVRDQSDALPDFSSISVATKGAVFTGIAMVKEDDFDNSTRPDPGEYDIECFGSALAHNPLSGITPFKGRYASFAFVVLPGLPYSNGSDSYSLNGENYSIPTLFDDLTTEPAEQGVDQFADDIFSTTPPGQLHVDKPAAGDPGDSCFAAVDIQDYAETEDQDSTQPNEDLKVEQDGRGASVVSPKAQDFLFLKNVNPNLFFDTRRVIVTFYDPDNAVESAPSPELVILAAQEDQANPSSDERIIFTDLPVSPDGRSIQRRIYVSQPGTVDLQLAVTVPDNSSSEAEFSGSDAVLGIAYTFREGAPPRCDVLAVGQSRMWYCGLEIQPNGYAYSEISNPERVPVGDVTLGTVLFPGNLYPLDTGNNARITGARDVQGQMYLFKRSGIWAVVVVDGRPAERQVSRNEGAVSPQVIHDIGELVYFISDRGPMMIHGGGLPRYLNRKLLTYWRDTLDDRFLSRTSAVIHRQRNQFIFTNRELGDRHPNRRWSIEYSHILGKEAGSLQIQSHRFSPYEEPRVTALGSVDAQGAGDQRVLAGTAEGFVVHFDRQDTLKHLVGPTAIYAPDTVTFVDAPANRHYFEVTGAISAELESLRGVVVRWLNSSSVEQEARILFVVDLGDGNYKLYFESQPDEEPPASATLSLGAIMWHWSTKWIDADSPYRKIWRRWDLTRVPQPSGQITMDVFENLAAAVVGSKVLNLDEARFPIDIGDLLQQAWQARFLFKTLSPAVGLDIELLEIAPEVDEADSSI